MQMPNFGCLSIINEMKTNTFDISEKTWASVWQSNDTRTSHSQPMHFQIHKMPATDSFPFDDTSSRFQQTSSASRKIAFYYYLCRLSTGNWLLNPSEPLRRLHWCNPTAVILKMSTDEGNRCDFIHVLVLRLLRCNNSRTNFPMLCLSLSLSPRLPE